MNIQSKVVYTISSLLILPEMVLAAGAAKSHPVLAWVMNNILVVMAGMLILGVLASLWNVMNAIVYSKQNEFLKEQGVSMTAKEPTSIEDVFSRFYTKIVGMIPMEKEKDILLNHDYDGIEELDNSLPPWWLYGFYFTILVAIGYMYTYHYSGIGLSQHEEYVVAMEKGEIQKAEFAARQANNIDEDNLQMLEDANALAVGMTTYKSKCAVCHGQEGQGGIGPNLCDSYWLHGGSTSHIYKTIKNGVPDKGMIAWKTQLQPSTMHKLASYIKSLAGTNPPNPKKSQGELFVEEI